ncbi:hypothetical protein D5S17_02085 [Pseudonocardiaceae bacterium YIM PH 21723]|nr:hypothetical protein D5S17_02085 [Pseudonocardiaceae bacterium YIM PH 21723]
MQVTLPVGVAAELVSGLDERIVELERVIVTEPGVELPSPATWDEIMPLAATADARRTAARFATALESAGVLDGVTAAGVLELLATGELDGLREVTGEHDEQLIGAVGSLITCAVLATGRGEFRLDWVDGSELLVDGREIGLTSLVRVACTSQPGAVVLRDLLGELGIPLDRRPERVAGDGRVRAVLTELAVGRRAHDLLVTDAAILLLRRPLFRLTVGQDRRALRYLDSTGDDLRGQRGARYVPDDQILRSELQERRFGPPVLRLTLTDGEALGLRATAYTQGYGDADILTIRFGVIV